MCSIPARWNIRNDALPRRSSSRGATPSGSRCASNRAIILRTSSNDNPGALPTRNTSASATRSRPAFGIIRSRNDTINSAAGAPIRPARNASRTTGNFAGSTSPSRFVRTAVACPTFTRRPASPVAIPVTVAIN